MKKVLFSHSYFYKFDSKQWKIAEPYPPLMTITAAALMRANGYEVALFDTALKDSPQEIQAVLDSFQPDYFVVFDDGFNYLTKMCLSSMREAAFDMQEIAKRNGATVITCSSDSTDHHEKYLTRGADFVIKGEGEITLLELVNGIENGHDLTQINGFYYSDNKEIVFSGNRAVNTRLDELPMAAWDLIDIPAYRKVWEKRSQPFYLNLATTRGCPYKCNWCAKPIYGNRYNTRSPEQVVDEVALHVNTHKVTHFWMCDDIFGLKPGWVQAFQKALEQRNLKIKFKIQSRADLLLKEDNIEALVAAGLDEVWIGAESGSQNILDAMDKGTSLDQIKESTLLLKQNGVKVAFFIQFGYLNEKQKDINQTIDMVLDLMPDKIGVSVSYPLPGTKFYDMVKQDLNQKSNWTDSDDLDMMFVNTFKPAYYKKLHRYLHNRYRTKRSVVLLKDFVKRPWELNYKKLRHMLAIFLHYPQGIINAYSLRKIATIKK